MLILFFLIKGARMESIKILLDGNNRSLLNFARMNKFKDDELCYICIELRKYLQNPC